MLFTFKEENFDVDHSSILEDVKYNDPRKRGIMWAYSVTCFSKIYMNIAPNTLYIL